MKATHKWMDMEGGPGYHLVHVNNDTMHVLDDLYWIRRRSYSETYRSPVGDELKIYDQDRAFLIPLYDPNDILKEML